MREAIEILRKVIQINSENPPGNEQRIVNFIKNYFKKIGINDYKIYSFKNKRPNIVCFLKPENKKSSLLFAPHLDTVPAGGNWRFAPFLAKIFKGKIYGRGATDCKVNVAACLYLIKKLKEKPLKNLELIFAFCGDEETGSKYGIIPLLKKIKKPEYAIVLDADEFEIIFKQKGLLHLKLEVFGKKAHGAYPERGINAIEKIMEVISKLKQNKFFLVRDFYLGKNTLNIGRISGGEKVNMVADYAFCELDFRYSAKFNEKQILNFLKKILKKLKIKYRLKILAQQSPIEVEKNLITMQLLEKILKKYKIKVKYTAMRGATVINFLAKYKVKVFAFGFGSKKNAHKKDEFVKIDNLLKGVKVLEDFIKSFDLYLENK